MNLVKKFAYTSMALMLALGISACGNNDGNVEEKNKTETSENAENKENKENKDDKKDKDAKDEVWNNKRINNGSVYFNWEDYEPITFKYGKSVLVENSGLNKKS